MRDTPLSENIFSMEQEADMGHSSESDLAPNLERRCVRHPIQPVGSRTSLDDLHVGAGSYCAMYEIAYTPDHKDYRVPDGHFGDFKDVDLDWLEALVSKRLGTRRFQYRMTGYAWVPRKCTEACEFRMMPPPSLVEETSSMAVSPRSTRPNTPYSMIVGMGSRSPSPLTIIRNPTSPFFSELFAFMNGGIANGSHQPPLGSTSPVEYPQVHELDDDDEDGEEPGQGDDVVPEHEGSIFPTT
ncbi:uncharacterized protein LTR77_001194 [Saxophila tyrrhenica]|uniref:Uncharacterized protein n=1 Tax=Saxophila tyrrhenica TaxID=1690608 RepID=A0AAV9PN20_9PEZI|nr:hypothetical protein LTR77_001194 [Saxophila tyrrhenica]